MNTKKELLVYALFSLLIIAIDQAAKYLAFNTDFGSFLNFLKPVMGKQIFRNYDFAFSLKVPIVLIYLIYTVLLTMLVTWFVKTKEHNKKITVAFVLILSGALSNILDRIVLGYVRDFISIFWGNIFNLADVYLVIGILLAIF